MALHARDIASCQSVLVNSPRAKPLVDETDASARCWVFESNRKNCLSSKHSIRRHLAKYLCRFKLGTKSCLVTARLVANSAGLMTHQDAHRSEAQQYCCQLIPFVNRQSSYPNITCSPRWFGVGRTVIIVVLGRLQRHTHGNI